MHSGYLKYIGTNWSIYLDMVGVDKVTIAYDPAALKPSTPGQIFSNTLTNASGATTTYRYKIINNDVKLLSAKGAGCSTCGETNVVYDYDTIGRLVKKQQFDDKGQLRNSQTFNYDNQGNIREN